MRIIFLIILVLLLCLPAHSNTGVKFLALETGAGPVGFGGAFAAYTAEPYSAAYNPAAIYGINSLSGSFGHDTYWTDRRFESGYVSFKKGPVVYNVGLQFSEISDIEARQTASEDPDFYFNSPDLSLKFSGAFKISEKITVGLAMGWIFEKIETYRGNAYVGDLGLIIAPRSDLTVGLSMQNYGTGLKINNKTHDLPLIFRLGTAYSYRNFKPAIDFVYFDEKIHTHFGGEYKIKDMFFLRAGYRSGYDSKDISAGAGFVRRNIRVDYAFLPYKNNLGDSHIFSLTFSL
jgi:hypothetical protein